MTFHGYVGLQSRGLIALPSELRRRMHLDEPGAQVEILERGDGVIELRAALPVPADQAWFWTEHWQRREREVDELVARGEVAVHESTDDFLTHLDELDSAAAKLGSSRRPLHLRATTNGSNPNTEPRSGLWSKRSSAQRATPMRLMRRHRGHRHYE